MKHCLALALGLLSATMICAQHADMQMKNNEKSATPMPGMGSQHHPVSTTKPEAQKFFDQGLGFVYAFNHDEAIRSFTRAAKLDPQMAMAYWGIALALGPNINLDVDPDREKAAYEATQKALSLAATAPENERAYIEALSRRYSIDPKADLKKLAVDYKNAMGELVKRYPDDLDAATLYAESAMNLRPWKFWSSDGKPAKGTEEIVATLESVLRRDPNHIGAIHYYIHAVEASSYPERALAYAPKLSSLAIAAASAGRLADAMTAARQLEAHVGPHLKEMPMLEGFMTVAPLILVQFNRWDDIEKLPQPDASMVATTAVWHFARGMAFDAKGRTADAGREYALLVEAGNSVPADARFGLNSAHTVLKIAENVLAARVKLMTKRDTQSAIELLRKTIEIEDSLAYDEPPAWFLPVRQLLGGALMYSGDYAGAEEVFRADLQRNRRNGRSLFGLMQSLKAQKKDYAAALVQREFESAWKNADTTLKIEDLKR